MRLPRFTTRDLLLAVTLISAGLGCLAAASQLGAPDFLFVGLFGMAFLGAGVFAPFHEVALGILVAVIVSVLVASALAIYALTWIYNLDFVS